MCLNYLLADRPEAERSFITEAEHMTCTNGFANTRVLYYCCSCSCSSLSCCGKEWEESRIYIQMYVDHYVGVASVDIPSHSSSSRWQRQSGSVDHAPCRQAEP